MELNLFHGRQDPGQPMDDWGFEGPTLRSVKRLHGTYGNLQVEFETAEDCQVAKRQTGWDDGVYVDSLYMRFDEDMVLVHVYTEDGNNLQSSWFGDWNIGP